MSATTVIRRCEETATRPLEHCHEGEGTLAWRDVFPRELLAGHRLRFLHDNVLPPGVSIGIHAHRDDEEYYVIIAGRGTMTLDGVAHPVGPGDVTGVFPGGSHGLVNDGDEDLRVLVFSVAH